MKINDTEDLNTERDQLEQLEKRVNIASMLKNNIIDENGASYFSNDWISKHILGLTEDEITENKNK